MWLTSVCLQMHPKMATTSSQKYRDYLEEMELKIRYMKNDIEFKTNQLQAFKNKDSSVQFRKGRKPCSFSSNFISNADTHELSVQPSRLNSVPVNYNKKWINSSTRKDCTQAGILQNVPSLTVPHEDTRTVKYRSPQKQTTIAVVPKSKNMTKSVPFNIIERKTVVPESAQINHDNDKAIIKFHSSNTATQQMHLGRSKTCSAHSIQSNDTSRTVILPARQADSKSLSSKSLASQTALLTQTDVKSQSSHGTTDSEVISIPSKNLLTWPQVQEKDKMSLYQNTLNTSRQSKTNSFSTSLSSNDPNKCVNSSMSIPSTFRNKYKLVNSQSSCGKVNADLSSSSVPELSSSKTGYHIPEYQQHMHSHTTFASISKATPHVDVDKITTPSRRLSNGSRKIIRKTPQLKVQTAAKLVSKYKLKRLSPTSVSSSTAPQGYFSQVGRGNSLLKLDRRNKTVKLQETGSAHYDEQSERIGMKHDSTYKYKHTKQYKFPIINKHKLDKRLANHSCHKHKLDRRSKQSAVNYNEVQEVAESYQSTHNVGRTPLKRSKHSWTCGQAALTMGQNESARKRGRAVSKFRWRRLSNSSSKVTENKTSKYWSGLSQGNRSQFKWSRPFVQAENASAHQFRQRLRLLKQTRSVPNFSSAKKFQSTSNKSCFLSRRAEDKTSLMMIGGILYQGSTRKLTRAGKTLSLKRGQYVCTTPMSIPHRKRGLRKTKMKLITVRGVHFEIDATGKKLSRKEIGPSSNNHASPSVSRIDIGGITYVQTRPGVLEKLIDDKTRLAASRVVNRSIAIAAAKFKKDNRKAKLKRQYCIFFGRFGRCHRGNRCPFIHDPDKVAVCTRFLRGKCEVENCPFSHSASVHKMPVCLFYLRSSCSHENCPYLHVNVNPSAPVCKDFLNGFCGLGETCKKLHSFVCPSFAALGYCSRGTSCSMLHRKSKKLEAAAAHLAKTRVKAKGKQRTVRRRGPSGSGISDPALSSSSTTLTITSTSKPLEAQPSFISLVTSVHLPNDGTSGTGSECSDKLQQSLEKPVITPTFLFEKNLIHESSKTMDSEGVIVTGPDSEYKLSSTTMINKSIVCREAATHKTSQDASLSEETNSKLLLNRCDKADHLEFSDKESEISDQCEKSEVDSRGNIESKIIPSFLVKKNGMNMSKILTSN